MSRDEMRQIEKEEKKAVRDADKLTKANDNEVASIHSAKIHQRKQESDNLLLLQLSSSKNQRLKNYMQLNSSYEARADFGTNEEIMRRHADNSKKIDKLLDQLDSIESTIEEVYEKSVAGPSSPKRSKTEDSDDSVSLLSHRNEVAEESEPSSAVDDGYLGLVSKRHVRLCIQCYKICRWSHLRMETWIHHVLIVMGNSSWIHHLLIVTGNALIHQYLKCR